jgi:hypothetical protein
MNLTVTITVPWTNPTNGKQVVPGKTVIIASDLARNLIRDGWARPAPSLAFAEPEAVETDGNNKDGDINDNEEEL